MRTAARILQTEQPNLYRHASVGTHLDKGQVLTDSETTLDVLRDIFPRTRQCDVSEMDIYYTSDRESASSSFYDESGVSLGLDYCPSLSLLVESCAQARNLPYGMALHHHIVYFGLERNPCLSDNLAWMYGRCGFSNDAFYGFDNMGDRSMTIWSFMIGLHVEHNRSKRGMAFRVYQQSLSCNVFPDPATMTNLLACCAREQDLFQGKQMHVLIKATGYASDVVVGTALLSMYSRCNVLQEARDSFHEILEKNVVSWSAMITACVQHDSSTEAIMLFTQMQQEGLLPNDVTLVSTVSACAKERNIEMGKYLHVQVPKDVSELNVALATALVNMYGKCGSIEDACMIFQAVNEPCVIFWTGMLTAYCHQGYVKEVTQTFCQMLERGVLPNEVTYLCMISLCEGSELLPAGKRIHAQISSSGSMLNSVLSTAITLMYGKCGSMMDSHQIFSSLEEKCPVSWNAMISLCVDKGQSHEGIQFFSHMQQQGLTPDKFTYVCVLQACACVSCVLEGKKVHVYCLHSEFRQDIFVCNALMDMYSKWKHFDAVQVVFDEMQERDTVSWNLLITCYTQSGCGEKALVLLHEMQREKVVPDHVTFAAIMVALSQSANLCECWRMHTLIIQMGCDSEVVVATKLIYTYRKSGSFDGARLVFERLHERDDTLWSAFLTAHDQLDSLQAIQLLDQIKIEGFLPSIPSITKCLSVCTSHGALAKIKQLYVCVFHSGAELVDKDCMFFFVHMYSECGDLRKAEEIFCFSAHNHDLKSRNFMIAALARHGKGSKAIEIFKGMEGLGAVPDDATFINLLSACCHNGLSDEAYCLLRSVMTLWSEQAAVIHFDGVIDLLGRAGQMYEAVLLIENMPFKPTPVTWTSLLGACTVMLDMQGGKWAADHLVEVSEEGFVPYILLFNLDARLNQTYS